jgi:hypothetical protein
MGLVASPSLPKLVMEPCASPMRNTPAGVGALSIHAVMSSTSDLRVRGADGTLLKRKRRRGKVQVNVGGHAGLRQAIPHALGPVRIVIARQQVPAELRKSLHPLDGRAKRDGARGLAIVDISSHQNVAGKGWELTRESMALVGWPIPLVIRFQIDGRDHVRATRVAKLDQLAKAISAIDEDIRRLVKGTPALNYHGSDIERLRQEKSALVELQKRAGRSGCAGSMTVIEALFPDIPIKKKTASEDAEDEQWLAIRKEAGLKIDPETAEVDWKYRQTLDPYGIRDEWELPEEFHQWGREFFARSPGSDVWVHFSHLPDGVEEKLWTKLSSQGPLSPPSIARMPPTGTEDADLPF